MPSTPCSTHRPIRSCTRSKAAIDASATGTARVIVTTNVATVPETALSRGRGRRSAGSDRRVARRPRRGHRRHRLARGLRARGGSVGRRRGRRRWARRSARRPVGRVGPPRPDGYAGARLLDEGDPLRLAQLGWRARQQLRGQRRPLRGRRHRHRRRPTATARSVVASCRKRASRRRAPARTGVRSRFGRGAAVPCTFSSDCHHGTHVASTAAGDARSRAGTKASPATAGIVAIRIGQNSGGRWVFPSSDLHQALQRVLVPQASRAPHRRPSTSASAAAASSRAVRRRRPDRPPPHPSAARGWRGRDRRGRQQRSDEFVSWPACLPYVYAVSATDDADRIAGFSNRAPKTRVVGTRRRCRRRRAGWPEHQGVDVRARRWPRRTSRVPSPCSRECPGNPTPASGRRRSQRHRPHINAGGVRASGSTCSPAAARNVRNNNFANAEAVPAVRRHRPERSERVRHRPSRRRARQASQNSVWFRWTPRRTGQATDRRPTTSGGLVTTFNTELSVFTGHRLDRLAPGRLRQRRRSRQPQPARFIGTAGTTYRIRVDGVQAQNGRFHLHLVPPGAG